MALELDEDDLEMLGWGRVEMETNPAWQRAAQARLEQVREAGRKYSKTEKGKAARAAYEASEKGRAVRRAISLRWARRNMDVIKANNKKFRAKNPNYQREYRARKKAERARQVASQGDSGLALHAAH